MAKMSKPGAVLTERKEYYCTPLVPASTCGNLLEHFPPIFSAPVLLNFWQAQSIITRKKQHRGENNTTTPDRLSQNTEQGLALKEKKITQQYVGCYERLFKTRFKQVLSNHSTH